jgi:integrase
LPFAQNVTRVHEADIKAWLIGWDRSLKTKANYHGLLFGAFNHALELGFITVNPCQRTASKRSRIRQTQADLRFLTEAEFTQVADAAGENADMLTVTVGTGMRFGEVTALWVSDVDLRHRTVRINKAWKRDGEDDEQDTPLVAQASLRTQAQDARPPPGQPQNTPVETNHRDLRRARLNRSVSDRRQGGGRLRLHGTHRASPAQRGLLRAGLATADGRRRRPGRSPVPVP